MANELKKVGLVFTEEGAIDFKKSLQDINLELNKNYNQFKLTQAQWDSSTSSTEKLRAQQEYLTNAYQIQEDRVKLLRIQLEELENSENKNTTAINKKRNELTKAEIKLQEYNGKLKEVDAQLSDSNQKLQQYGKKISEVSEKISDVGNKASVISAGVLAGGTILANSAMNLEDAVAKYVSSTNTAEEETQKYKKVLENINKNNYGEGYEDIADSMAQVTMQLKDLNEQDLQNITEKAIALRDLFGYDVSESVRAVKAMMDNLNVSADEAFNLISEGKKQGLDFSNELLDNINEYSVQFGKLGLSAEDMFNIFKVGADNGAFNLDKIGDAVKEFSIRVIDGSNTTEDGFKRIGLNADKMAKKFANGGEEAKQAFIEVVNRLGSMDDKVSQSIAGVDLFGTMWEDLGPTVITSFSKMDSGISKSSDSMQKSIDQLYNTTKKKAETQLKRLQSLGADFGEEMLPVLEDLIDMAEGFTEKLEGMSDAEKENILKIGLFVAAAGPLIKTIGTAGQTIGNVTNGIGILSQAVGVMQGKISSTSTTVNSLADILKGMTANPILTLSTATIGLTAAMITLKAKQIEEKVALDGVTESIDSQKSKMDELVDARNKVIESSSNEIVIIQELADELKEITDENGKVKEGYENRANYIVNELNNALGTEYKINGNIISQYEELANNIDTLIAKKKAEAVLNAYQEEYGQALKQQQEATANLINLRQQLADAQKNSLQLTGIEKNENEQLISKIGSQIKEQTELISQYGKTISDYEKLQTASVQNSAEEIDKAVTQMGISWERAKEQNNESIEQQINSQTEYLKILKETINEAINTNDVYQQTILEKQLETEEKQLENLVTSLVNQTSTIKNLSPEQILAWKNIANESLSAYSTGLNQLPVETQKKIQEATGIINNDTTLQNAAESKAILAIDSFSNNLTLGKVTENELTKMANTINNNETVSEGAENLANKVKETLNLKSDSEVYGKDIVEGMGEGIKNKSESSWFTKILTGFTNKIKAYIHFSKPDKGPLREYEKWMPDMVEGLANTLEKSSPLLVDSVKEMSGKVAKELNNVSPNLNTNSSFSGTIQKEIDYDKMANAITKALTNCKFTIDEDGFAKIIKDEIYKVV